MGGQLEAAQGGGAALESQLAKLRATLDETETGEASLRDQLSAALAATVKAETAQEDIRKQLAEALALKLAAEEAAEQAEAAARTRAQEVTNREALLAAARQELEQQTQVSTEAQRRAALLNQQVATLRDELGQLRALLDDYKARDAAQNIQIENLGSDLNVALAQKALEERRRADAEARNAALLAAEKARLEEEAKDLERYRSEFFGRLRDLLGSQEGVRIEGDRFVFSSSVLFGSGDARLSDAGQHEIAKVANILKAVADDIPDEIDWVIRVDGHTDDVPIVGSAQFADNWELSQARALSVVRYMINFLGIAPERLAANGFGQFQPVDPGTSEAARARNRRIELKLTEK